MMAFRHASAMPQEVLTFMALRPGGTYADCTLGGAGHARAICEQIAPNGTLVGIDQDIAAIDNAKTVLKPFGAHVHLFHGNFVNLPEYLNQLHINALDGILMDLGLSQYQLEASGRGFSFQKDEPLDMRMDSRSETTAADMINQFPEGQLIDIFKRYGEERWSKRIAREIVNARGQSAISTTGQLVELVRRAVPGKAAAQQKIHPATRIFMALRIAVNQELAVLEQFIEEGINLLKPGGRMCVLSFHSLEDRIVKQRFKKLAQSCTCPPDLPRCACSGTATIKLITRKVVRPTPQEVASNPMARSTRLRCAEKLDESKGTKA